MISFFRILSGYLSQNLDNKPPNNTVIPEKNEYKTISASCFIIVDFYAFDKLKGGCTSNSTITSISVGFLEFCSNETCKYWIIRIVGAAHIVCYSNFSISPTNSGYSGNASHISLTFLPTSVITASFSMLVRIL